MEAIVFTIFQILFHKQTRSFKNSVISLVYSPVLGNLVISTKLKM